MNTERALATIRRISELKPIKDADRIEVAVIDGWNVVVKKGEFNVGDLCVYLEVDSWVPHDLAPFLTINTERFYNGVKGNRLKTVKLRGQLSQGLVLPLTHDIHVLFAETFEHSYEARYLIEGDDVTELLGIQKYEKPLAACLAGTARSNFPSAIPKTDQERIQNLTHEFESFLGMSWEITEKLDGSSCTFYLDNDCGFHVCSRNLDLLESDSNAFWIAARKYDIEQKMLAAGLCGFAIQGELLGYNIQGNQYGLADGEYRFYVFDIYDSNKKTYLTPVQRVELVSSLDIPHAPILKGNHVEVKSIPELLSLADGASMINGSAREGIVYKSLDDDRLSFKVISNKWLLKNE